MKEEFKLACLALAAFFGSYAAVWWVVSNVILGCQS